MPFTLSHPAAVFPLRRLGLPVTAMVVGSMVPDVPLFLRWQHGWHHGYRVSHSLLGAGTADVALTLVLVWLWFVVIRDALVDLSPDAVRSRLAWHVSLTLRQWCLVVPAAGIGAMTHVLWDAFTHRHRWGVGHVAWLQVQHAGLPGYKWAQYLSGAVGLALVALAAVGWLRGRSRVRHPVPRPAWVAALLPAAATAALAAGGVSAWAHERSGFHAMALHGVVNAILAAVVALATLCLLWRGLRFRTAAQ